MATALEFDEEIHRALCIRHLNCKQLYYKKCSDCIRVFCADCRSLQIELVNLLSHHTAPLQEMLQQRRARMVQSSSSEVYQRLYSKARYHFGIWMQYWSWTQSRKGPIEQPECHNRLVIRSSLNCIAKFSFSTSELLLCTIRARLCCSISCSGAVWCDSRFTSSIWSDRQSAQNTLIRAVATIGAWGHGLYQSVWPPKHLRN